MMTIIDYSMSYCPQIKKRSKGYYKGQRDILSQKKTTRDQTGINTARKQKNNLKCTCKNIVQNKLYPIYLIIMPAPLFLVQFYTYRPATSIVVDIQVKMFCTSVPPMILLPLGFPHSQGSSLLHSTADMGKVVTARLEVELDFRLFE